MENILYVDSSILSKSARGKWYEYTIVRIDEELPYGKVKISTYIFDIPCAYYPVNRIGIDVIDRKGIKVLDWNAVINDLKKGYINRKYWYLWFLYREYGFSCHYEEFGSNVLCLYYKDNEIGKITFPVKGNDVVLKLDMFLSYMIDNGIDSEYAKKLLSIIREDKDVSMSNEEYFEMKGYIKKTI